MGLVKSDKKRKFEADSIEVNTRLKLTYVGQEPHLVLQGGDVGGGDINEDISGSVGANKIGVGTVDGGMVGKSLSEITNWSGSGLVTSSDGLTLTGKGLRTVIDEATGGTGLPDAKPKLLWANNTTLNLTPSVPTGFPNLVYADGTTVGYVSYDANKLIGFGSGGAFRSLDISNLSGYGAVVHDLYGGGDLAVLPLATEATGDSVVYRDSAGDAHFNKSTIGTLDCNYILKNNAGSIYMFPQTNGGLCKIGANLTSAESLLDPAGCGALIKVLGNTTTGFVDFNFSPSAGESVTNYYRFRRNGIEFATDVDVGSDLKPADKGYFNTLRLKEGAVAGCVNSNANGDLMMKSFADCNPMAEVYWQGTGTSFTVNDYRVFAVPANKTTLTSNRLDFNNSTLPTNGTSASATSLNGDSFGFTQNSQYGCLIYQSATEKFCHVTFTVSFSSDAVGINQIRFFLMKKPFGGSYIQIGGSEIRNTTKVVGEMICSVNHVYVNVETGDELCVGCYAANGAANLRLGTFNFFVMGMNA